MAYSGHPPSRSAVFIFVCCMPAILSCDLIGGAERTRITEADFAIMKMFFCSPELPSDVALRKVYFRKGGLGAPGELLYQITCSRKTLEELLRKAKASSVDHGLTKKIFPFETGFKLQFKKATLELSEAYVSEKKIDVSLPEPIDATTYYIVDSDTSSSVTVYIKTEPRYTFIAR